MFLLNFSCGHLIYSFSLLSYLIGMLFIFHIFVCLPKFLIFHKILVKNSTWDGFSALKFVNSCLFLSIWSILKNVLCALKGFCYLLFMYVKKYIHMNIYSLLNCYFIDSRTTFNYSIIISFLFVYSSIFITMFMI